MIRLELKADDGRPLAVKLDTKDLPTARATTGSVFLLASRHGARTPVQAGPRVLVSQFANGLRASFHRDNRGLERLADCVVGWEGVRLNGEPVECSRSLVIELLRSRLIRQQVIHALRQYDRSGILV